MEKTKTLILLAVLLSFTKVSDAQKLGAPPFLHKGMMNMTLGITAAAMTFNPLQEVYFNGSFSYCFEQQIAVRTDINVFIPDYYFEGQLQKNSSIFFGPEFHFPFGRFDMSMLFEPGIAFPGVKDVNNSGKSQAEPVIVTGLGFYYFLFQNFHVFTSVTYLHGNYYPESTDPFRLDEVRISAGLGVNIFVNHTAAYDRKSVKF